VRLPRLAVKTTQSPIQLFGQFMLIRWIFDFELMLDADDIDCDRCGVRRSTAGIRNRQNDMAIQRAGEGSPRNLALYVAKLAPIV
jgi:hypothetical protein